MRLVNPQRDWEKFGTDDAFFGVISSEEYRAGKLDQKGIDKFYQQGEQHIASVLKILRVQFGYLPKGRALDFGSGVGRLTFPLAAAFESALGLDIAPGMIAEAQAQAQKRGVRNASFALSTAPNAIPRGAFSLIHTYIVMQHIPRKLGDRIFADLVAGLEEGGVGAIHLTYGHQRGRSYHRAREFLKQNPLTRAIANLMKGRKWNEPVMLMTGYDIPTILQTLGQAGVNIMHVHKVDDWGHLGLYLFFRKTANGLSDFSNPVV